MRVALCVVLTDRFAYLSGYDLLRVFSILCIAIHELSDSMDTEQAKHIKFIQNILSRGNKLSRRKIIVYKRRTPFVVYFAKKSNIQ